MLCGTIVRLSFRTGGSRYRNMAKRKNRKVAPVQHQDKKNNQILTRDAFSNPAARIGFGTMDLLQATDYPMTRMTQNYQLLTSMYRDNWIVQNVVSTIPNDMVRKWYEVKTAAAPEYLDKLKRLERTTGIRRKILDGLNWGRLYGGAAGLILIKGQQDLSEPLDLDMILPDTFLGLQIVDRWTGIYPGSELVTDPSDRDYGLPEYYTVRDEEMGHDVARVHHSRIIRFIGRELPWLEKVTENYWGESELEAIYNEVVKRDNVSGNIASLTFRANVNYLESDGLDQLLGTGNAEMQRRFWNTMQAQSVLESNFGTRIINKGDAIHNTQYTFTGLAEVYDRIMMDVAGAARTPVTKLFGRSPAGMNATGESDMKNYYDYIDGLRETILRPILEQLLPIMALSAWGIIPDDMDISFPEMEEAKPEDKANVVEKKTSAIIAAYQNDLIDQKAARQELQRLEEETGLFGKITDELAEAGEGVTYTSARLLQDPMAGITLGE